MPERSLFCLEVYTDHNRNGTFMRLCEYGKTIKEIPYVGAGTHYQLLVTIVEEFKGRDSCGDGLKREIMGLDQKRFRENMTDHTYWNRPLHDTYAI